MSWGSFSNLEEKKKVKDEYWPYGFYWVTFSKKDHEHSKYYWNPKMFLYFFFNEWLWRQKVLCLTWSFFCYAGIHDTSPSFFRWGTVLWGMLLQIFTCWLPFYACCYWKAGKLSQSGYAKNTSKSKQLPGIELWKSVEGTEIQWNLSSRPFW